MKIFLDSLNIFSIDIIIQFNIDSNEICYLGYYLNLMNTKNS
jgi:hypothetical protein